MYPVLYYLVAVGLLAALIYVSRLVGSNHPNPESSGVDARFLGIALLLLVSMRFPSIAYNRELNVDESQLLTQAITIRQDPVYGRSVDGTSIGPVNTYLLLIPGVFGLPLDYTAARLTALLLIGVALLLSYRSLRHLTTPFVSRLSFLPVLFFFAFTTEGNFLHYSSELSSLVILAACFGLVLRTLRRSAPPSAPAMLGLGILTGLTVYCKLQTLPIIGLMLITLAIYLWSMLRWKVLNVLLVLAAGFLLPTLVVFGQAYWFGTERYFTDYYFVGNLTTYSQIYAHVPLVSQSFGAKLIRFPAFIKVYSDFVIFILFNCVLAIGGALLLARFQRRSRLGVSWVDLLVGSTILGALWAVITPGTEFGHHLLLLVLPLGWGMALALHRAMQATPNRQTWLRLTTALVGLYVLEVVVTDNVALGYARHLKAELNNTAHVMAKSDTTTSWQVSSNPYLFLFPARTVLQTSTVSRVIRQYTLPTDKIAVWGWNCMYYVETGLAQGVRENHTQRSAVPNRMQAAYLNRYAEDLMGNRPVVFVDAVGKNSLNLTKPRYLHERFALISRIIEQNYGLVASIDQVRVYVRRDRLHSHSQKSTISAPF